MLLGFDIFRHIIPIRDNSKIIHLHPLNRSGLNKDIVFYIVWIYSDPNLFFCLTQRTFSKEFTILYLATRKRPESRPSIELKWSSYKEYMRSMETDSMSTRSNEMRHENHEKLIIKNE
jgi:hypothetical protein